MKRARKHGSCLGLFAGIGGIELGLERAGYEAQMLCEIDSSAVEVLKKHFAVPVYPDVTKLKAFPKVDLIAAGREGRALNPVDVFGK